MRIDEQDKGKEISSLMAGKIVYLKDRCNCTKQYERCEPIGCVKRGNTERLRESKQNDLVELCSHLEEENRLVSLRMQRGNLYAKASISKKARPISTAL
jgi:hypothetical protein